MVYSFKHILLTAFFWLCGLSSTFASDFIDYFIVFDSRAADWAMANKTSLESYAQDIVDNINLCMQNSRVEGRFRLAGYMVVDETFDDTGYGLSYATSNSAVVSKKKQVKADIICMLIEHPTQNSITGSSIPAALTGDASSAACCVRCSQAVSGFVAAHETAHVMGCGHSRAMGDAGYHEYAVGCERGKYSTLLSDVASNHLLMLSGVGNYYDGVEMGSITEDNARMVREKWDMVASFSDATTSIYKLDRYSWNTTCEASTTTIKLENGDFNITSSASWLDAYILVEGKKGVEKYYNGSGPEQIILEVDRNESPDVRTGVITLSSSRYADTYIVVTQEADEATSIKKLTTYPAKSKDLYDMSGRKLFDGSNILYIRNGRKMLQRHR